MDIYEEIAELLGLRDKPNDIESVESRLLEELNDLNENYRTLQNQIDSIRDEINRLQSETGMHNQEAISYIKKNREDLARQELEKKEKKMNTIQSKEKQLGNIRENIDRIETRRRQIEDKLEKIRRRMN